MRPYPEKKKKRNGSWVQVIDLHRSERFQVPTLERRVRNPTSFTREGSDDPYVLVGVFPNACDRHYSHDGELGVETRMRRSRVGVSDVHINIHGNRPRT